MTMGHGIMVLWYYGCMAIDFKPHETTGKIASRWLMQSGTLSRAEQLILDAWISRRSRDLRNTIGRECALLYEMGVFDSMPDMRIVPQVDTVMEVGARKFLAWTEKVVEAIPHVVRSGFAKPFDVAKKVVAQLAQDPFADVEQETPKVDYSPRIVYRVQTQVRDGMEWEHAMVRSATIVLNTPDLKEPFFSAFPSLEEATVFTFHHEAAHAAMLARLNFNPILADIQWLAPRGDDADWKACMDWERDSWAGLLSIRVPEGNGDLAPLDTLQTLWGEYYADVGAALLHARHGYSTQYLPALSKARFFGDEEHRTHPVLFELAEVLDFHPIVLKEKIDAFDLHSAIGKAIAPQMGRDILKAAAASPVVAMMMENSLPALTPTSQTQSVGYASMNEAMGGQYPRLALLLAGLRHGPTLDEVAQGFSGNAPAVQATDFAIV